MNETTITTRYAGPLLRPSGDELPAGFTAQPQHYDGKHRPLIFFQRQGISEALVWSDGRIRCEIFEHIGRKQNGKEPLTVKIEHQIAGENRTPVYETVPSRTAGYARLLDYLPQGFEIAPVTLAGYHGWAYPHQHEDAILSPLRYNAQARTIELLSRGGMMISRDLARFAEASLELEILAHGEREAGLASFREKVAAGWGSWIHDCDREKGLDYCRRRITWLFAETCFPHDKRGLLARDMEQTHPLAAAVAALFEAEVPA